MLIDVNRFNRFIIEGKYTLSLCKFKIAIQYSVIIDL